MKFIVAGNYKQFLNYCREISVNPHSGVLRYVSDENCLRGIINPDVEFIGTWYERNDASEIRDMIKQRTRPQESGAEPVQCLTNKGQNTGSTEVVKIL